MRPPPLIRQGRTGIPPAGPAHLSLSTELYLTTELLIYLHREHGEDPNSFKVFAMSAPIVNGRQ